MPLTVAAAIASRRATRKFEDKDIPADVLDRVVSHALEAPSSFNLQLRDLVVIRDPEVKQALFEASGQRQFVDAPVVLVTVARAETFPKDAEEILGAERKAVVAQWRDPKTPAELREAGMKDAMLVAGFALLAAQAEGLATSPTTGWDEEKVKEAIGLGGRDDRAIGLVTAVGYPAEFPAHPGRAADRLVIDRY